MKWILIFSLAWSCSVLAQEPALPAGLGGSSGEPSLPAGLGGSPSGIDADSVGADSSPKLELPFDLNGFVDARAGSRVATDPNEDDWPLAESRLQLEADHRGISWGARVVADFLYDDAQPDIDRLDLTRGTGWLDLREANLSLTPLDFADVKIGRQILTWGTGDLLFINDNFPKDWVSFFSGRDVEYLKAPSDAVRLSLFSGWANLDVVYTPRFDPDRFISGERFSYFNAGAGETTGQDAVADPLIPDEWFSDDEWAVRAYRTIGGIEVAAYGYDGYWKSPAGQTMEGQATFPRLSVYGASIRGKALGGIGNLEVGRMDSRDDNDGSNPMIRNSELRLLAGYERDLSFIARDFTLGVQYYLERIEDYDAYEASLPEGMLPADESRHVVTLRLTKMLMQQNLELSLFTYYSPSDEDAYLRPNVSYKVSDNWMVTAGGNLFYGDHDHTFFGQFEKNNNAYAGVRYSF